MLVHDYILVDVMEVYRGKSEHGVSFEPEFEGHAYVIGCYSCEMTRTVRQDTFDKLVKHGLLEGVGEGGE